jgi:hypothetical protein
VWWDAFLTAGFTQQALRRESWGHVVVFVSQDGRKNAEVLVIHSRGSNGPANKLSMGSHGSTDQEV